MQIAIVLFPRLTVLDAIGPYQTLDQLPGGEVVFVAEQAGPVRDETGQLGLVADAALAEVPGITLVSGPLAEGWKAAAPYDVLFIEGAVEEIPPALAAQLRVGSGRLVAVRAVPGRPGQAVIGEASPAGLTLQPAFDCVAPALPSLRRVAGFVF